MPSIGEILGGLFGQMAGAQDGAHVRIWNELKPWFSNLLPAASRKWLPRIMSDVTCEVPTVRNGELTGEECSGHAVSACDVCHRPVCLQHARIDMMGDAICFICVADATRVVPPFQRERARAKSTGPHAPPRQQGAPPPPPKPGHTPQQIAAALRLLGVPPTATWDEVKAAHKKLMVKHHPDRQRSARDKARAEAKFKQVQQAFEVLKTVYPDAA